MSKKVKFCGNCNPEVHPRYVREALDNLPDDTEGSPLLLVNGCSRACLTKGMKNFKGASTAMSARELVGRKG